MSLALTDYDIGEQLTEFEGDKMQQHIRGITADLRLCIARSCQTSDKLFSSSTQRVNHKQPSAYIPCLKAASAVVGDTLLHKMRGSEGARK